MQTRTVAVGSTDLPHQYVVAMDRLGPLLWTIDNGRTLRPQMQVPKISRYAYVSEELPRLVAQVERAVSFIEEELSSVGLHPGLKTDTSCRHVIHEFPARVRPVLDELANLVEKHPTVEAGHWLGETDFSEHMQLVKPLLQRIELEFQGFTETLQSLDLVWDCRFWGHLDPSQAYQRRLERKSKR